MQTADNGDKRHYGAVLYIDGVRVKGKKTFKSRSNFFGFKQGNGAYAEFIF